MKLPPFLLDHWLQQERPRPIRFDLAASTGPKWTLGALQALGDGIDLTETKLGYLPPQGSVALRQALGRYLGVDPDWVTVTTGASEAVSILLFLHARAGATVVLPRPDFPAFDAMAQAWNLGVRSYTLDREAGYRHDPDAIVGASDAETVLALINTPHNPTGAVAAIEDIRTIAARLGEKGVPLVVDEVYHPLHFGQSVPSAAGVDNVILIGDMSKALSLAGLRIGWIVDADAERRESYIDARSYFTISGSPLLERLAAHALDNHRVILDRLATVAAANLAELTSFIDSHADTFAWVRPQGGTVSFPWFRDGQDARPFATALADAGVLVAPGDCFGQPAHMRVGFAAEADGFSEALSIFDRVLRSRR
jgi:aspartate/methionine/tyrosine aminotransferase